MKKTPRQPPPACYALVLPGLEAVAAEEIETELGGEVKRTGPGLVVFRIDEIDARVLALRTTEDVFLMAWGTDQLSYRARDLESIRRWTAREPDWDQLFRLHHALRPKPKGRPTYRLVAQMSGHHGYRRVDAGKALAQGLAGKIPASWPHVDEDAALEIWLTIHEATAICGVRLSDRTMRHRSWKAAHRPASLRPTVAAALVRLAGLRPGFVLLDPMCGVGTILAEALEFARAQRLRDLLVRGGDLERSAVRAAADNLRRLGAVSLADWDARHLPLADRSIDRIISNPPFGKQLGRDADLDRFYAEMIAEYDRVLRPGGRAVLVVSAFPALRRAARAVGWKLGRQLRLRLLGQSATISVWHRGAS